MKLDAARARSTAYPSRGPAHCIWRNNAKHLLYYFATLEIIFCGIAWALYQNQYAERLFGQLLKIGLVLFIVGNFTFILNSILDFSRRLITKFRITIISNLTECKFLFKLKCLY